MHFKCCDQPLLNTYKFSPNKHVLHENMEICLPFALLHSLHILVNMILKRLNFVKQDFLLQRKMFFNI